MLSTGRRRGLAQVACVVLLAVVTACGKAEPSQPELQSWFVSHRASFERLRALVERPPRVTYLSFEGGAAQVRTSGTDFAPVDPNDARTTELQALMRTTGVTTINGANDLTNLTLWITPGGLRGQDAKGFTFARRAPKPLVSSVDEPARTRYVREHEIYAKLGGDWYVFFLFGD